MPAEQLTMRDHALNYARSGLEVFPVRPNKAPYTENGMKDATADAAQVARWWATWPDALIGCRIPEDKVVLDVDPRHGGDKTWAELEAAYAPIKVGRQHHSGREDGGFHVWANRPVGKLQAKKLHDWARRNGVGHQAGKRSWTSGIDILHHGHRYTILPPSLHPDTGRPYAWDLTGEPLDLPPFLVALVTADAPTSQPARPRLVRDADSIADWFTANHSWHDILPAAGWTLVEGDGDSDGSKWRHPNASAESSASVRHGCLFVYSDNTDFDVTEEGDPRGITRFRAWATLEHEGDLSQAAHAAREARDGPLPSVTVLGPAVANPSDPWPDPRPLTDGGDLLPFPVHVFPAWIAQHVEQVAAEMQFPPDLPAQLAITALSIACAGVATVTVRGTWREPTNTYLVTAMPPSAGKSPAFRQMLGCLDEWEIELLEGGAAERALIEVKRAVLEKERTKHISAGDTAAAAAASDELRELPEPVAPRLMADDATPEKLIEMLREQRGRLALVSTEGGVFGLMTGRYSDKANLDVYLQAWSGDTIRVDRIGRPSSVVRNPSLTVGLTVQPSVIVGLADLPELTGRGLLARFMYSMPPSNVGRRDMHRPGAINEAVARRYSAEIIGLARRLHAIERIELTLDGGALATFNTWRQDLEDRRGVGGDLHHMAEWTTKLESTVARLAGLLALADDVPVGADVMERAVQVGRYWEAHARIVFDLWGGDPVTRRAGKILDWIVASGVDEVTLRDAYRAVRGITAADGAEAVTVLVDNGWLRSVDGRPLVAGRPGVPSPVLAVHPRSSHFRNNHVNVSTMSLKNQINDLLTLSENGDEAVTRDMVDKVDKSESVPDASPPDPAPVDNPTHDHDGWNDPE